jgi:signal transduction histidine kinase
MSYLKVLIVDDSESDAALLLRQLRKAGFTPTFQRVDTAEAMGRALNGQDWDVVLCDQVMPTFSGSEALKILHQKNLDIPLIVVSGLIGEDVAVEAMKAGAQDYVLKGNLKRLGPAVTREVHEAQSRRERQRAEQALRAREDELQLARKAEQMKDEFVGMVSHELKTPLTVIIGALSVARSEAVPPEQAKELYEDAIAEAENLSFIVDNLLELSRYRSHRLTLLTERTEIGPVIQNVVQKLQRESAIHHITTEMPLDIPAATVDRTRVTLVVHNLVENAIKYSPRGGDIIVFARRQDDELVVGVSDHGLGIPPEEQPKLFQDFQRLDAPHKYSIGGIGLGLKVCRILVEAHGGRIWLESAKDKGSTFFFTLPVAR